MEDKEKKRKSLRKTVSKIFLAQPISGMKPEIVSNFIHGNFNVTIAPARIKKRLLENDIVGLIDDVVNEMMKEAK